MNLSYGLLYSIAGHRRPRFPRWPVLVKIIRISTENSSIDLSSRLHSVVPNFGESIALSNTGLTFIPFKHFFLY